MKKLILITLYLFSVSNCGLESGNKDHGDTSLGSTLTKELVIGGSYDQFEKTIALRICYAFRSKNTNFRVNFLDKNFDFRLTERNCDNTVLSEDATSTLRAPYSSEPMFFDALSSMEYYKHLQTDKDGVLNSVCRSFLSGQTPSKVQTDGSQLKEISFYNDGSDSFKILTAYEKNNSFIIEMEERFSVDTTTGGDYQGLVTQVQKGEVCSNNRTRSFTQTLTSRPSKN